MVVMPKAYVIGELHVHDPEALKEYRDKVLETIEVFGGRFLARAGDPLLLEGDEPIGLPVILEFESQMDAMAWWNSPQYKAIHGIRLRSTVSRIIFVNGVRSRDDKPNL
jgi:uncharacterized protein (DUF1330 family)